MPAITLDMMEYSSDALARSAYVSNSQTQVTQGTGTPIGNLVYYGGLAASFDGVTSKVSGVCSSGAQAAGLGYIGKDWGAGITKIISGFKAWGSNNYGFDVTGTTITLTLQGSTDNFSSSIVNLVVLGPFSDPAGAYGEKLTGTTNLTAYRYHRIKLDSNTDYQFVTAQIQFFEERLTCYSESSIKTQGSYALKGIAAISDSLNKTLTRTVAPTVNLSGISKIKFDIRSTRTGSNIKIGFHDSGGTTTEVTPNIASANTFQTITLSMSPVSNANKDVIDSIIITIVNANAENTFYIDNMYAETVSGTVFFGCNF